MNLTKQFFKYVSQNIFGLLGTSCYILADTYFISQAAGTDGVTLLNLCLPVYNFIFAVGSMVGLGAATRYAILKAQGDERCQRYFSNAIFCACVLSVPFLLVGAFKYITGVFDVRLSATIYLVGFQFAKQVAAIFLSAFAGNMYDRIGFQDTYMILGGIALTVTLISAFTLAGKTKTEPLRDNAMTV